MKKMMYVVLSIIMPLLLLTPVNAAENTIYYEYNNSIYEFPNEEAFNYFKKNEMSNNGIATLATHNQYTTIYRVQKYKVWVGYHPKTPNWNKASQYVLSSGTSYTINGSYTYNGVNFGFTVNNKNDVSITYPADASRYSKLGVRADITLVRTKVDVYDVNTYLNTYYVNSAVPTSYYIATVYQ